MISNPRPRRTYEPVWLKLRKEHRCILVLKHDVLLPRIKRMISKEKHMDDGFKILNPDDNYFLVFTFDREKKELLIELTSKLGIRDING